MEHGTVSFLGHKIKWTILRIQEHGTLCFIGQPTFANPDQPHAFPFSETLFCRRV